MNRSALLEFINSDAVLARLWTEVRARMNGDAAHDEGHVLRVAEWTLRIAAAEVDGAEPHPHKRDEIESHTREALAAALLHDVVHVDKSSAERHRASELSAEAARPLLVREGFSEVAVERICAAIRDHSFSRGAVPETALGRALQDADRLDALGSIGIMRTIATGARMNSEWFHADDPWARRRPLNDRRYAIDHFFAKLLKIPDMMLTRAGREEACRRSEIMVQFIEHLGEEIGVSFESRS